jgi:hypothetical protein
MTAGEMIAAGASESDVAAALESSAIEIPGTGMTPGQMLDAGATPQQIAEIEAAAAAPGGIANPANAALMPSIGGAASGEAALIAAGAGGAGVTAAEVAAGTGAALKASKEIKNMLNPDDQNEPNSYGVSEASIFGIPKNAFLIGGGIIVASVFGYMALKKKL